jgi:hypothetical protein
MLRLQHTNDFTLLDEIFQNRKKKNCDKTRFYVGKTGFDIVYLEHWTPNPELGR